MQFLEYEQFMQAQVSDRATAKKKIINTAKVVRKKKILENLCLCFTPSFRLLYYSVFLLIFFINIIQLRFFFFVQFIRLAFHTYLY